MISNWLKRCRGLVDYLENGPTPISYFVLSFLSILILRTFWEHTLLVMEPVLKVTDDIPHYLLFYTSLALTLTLITSKVAQVEIGKAARIVMTGFVVLWIVPFYDRLSHGRDLYSVAYIFPEQGQILMRFLTFFGPLEDMGVTPGMRLEVFIVMVVWGFYIYLKTNKLGRAFLGAILAYITIFVYIITPVWLIPIMNFTGLTYQFSPRLIIDLFLLLSMIQFLLVSYIASPGVFKTLIKDIRCTRLLHYQLFLVLGFVMGLKTSLSPIFTEQWIVFRAIELMLALGFAWIFSVIMNNIVDQKIDRVSNPSRPLISGNISVELYRRIGWGMLIAAILFAIAVDQETLLLIAAFLASYFLYSMPPFRMKRIPIISKVSIGFNSLLAFMLGHMFIGHNINISLGIIIFFLIFSSLTANLIDLKDYSGDLQAGIRTLPVLCGMAQAQKVVGASFFISYLIAAYAFKVPELKWLFLAVGVLQAVLINRKPYNEKPVMVLHITVIAFLIIYISLRPNL